MTERPAISVVADQYGSPTYAADLAAAVISIIRSGKWIRGIYHYTNEGETSWYEFAGTIRELISSSCIITPIPTTDYPTPARRPAYSVLDKTGIKETYGIIIPAWRESLGKCIAKLQPH